MLSLPSPTYASSLADMEVVIAGPADGGIGLIAKTAAARYL
jgi:hypothetical protein